MDTKAQSWCIISTFIEMNKDDESTNILQFVVAVAVVAAVIILFYNKCT
jgi:hypothetical protein